jgi:uncharacterized protein YhfF
MKPTDEEIEKFAIEYGGNHAETPRTIDAVMVGAKWARDQQQKWIRVEDQLPEPGKDVLVLNKKGFAMVARISQVMAELKKIDWYEGGRWVHDIEFWQLLPEKP